MASRPRSERSPNLREPERRHIFKKVQENPRTKALEIICTVWIVWKILKKSGYRCRVTRRKWFISHFNKKRRIDFVKEHIKKVLEKRIFLEKSKMQWHYVVDTAPSSDVGNTTLSSQQ